MKTLSQYDIKVMFKIAYNNATNFMTPDVIKYGMAGNYVYELSTGTGFMNDSIYGVSVLERNSGNKRHDLSKCFGTEAKAYNYIEDLRGNDDSEELGTQETIESR
jgi:hypothetical protein